MSIFIFLLGTIIGSFLNVCIYRIPNNKSIVYPGSRCPACSTPLKWYDLVPILSFLQLKGKCRYCREKISPRYPIVELLSGTIYLFLYIKSGLGINFIYYGFLISILIIITFIDVDYQIIPNTLTLLIFILDILYKFMNFLIYNLPLNLINHLLGLIVGFILFLLIFILSKGGMGGGDVKLMGVFGFTLGIPRIFLNIFLSFVLGGIISIFLLAFKIKKRKDPIAFGPFLIIGFLVSLFWGYEIIDWYLFNSL
ncbi:MAG: prepilin peptidase [Tissierellia bacterium]|nr:prepilin peptidase [Tissierellia bacterium]